MKSPLNVSDDILAIIEKIKDISNSRLAGNGHSSIPIPYYSKNISSEKLNFKNLFSKKKKG